MGTGGYNLILLWAASPDFHAIHHKEFLFKEEVRCGVLSRVFRKLDRSPGFVSVSRVLARK
jgi:hypothetical protein